MCFFSFALRTYKGRTAGGRLVHRPQAERRGVLLENALMEKALAKPE